MDESGRSMIRIPDLDGAFKIDETSLQAMADDFGHLRHLRPIALLEPASAEDVIEMVGFAREQRIRIGPRGWGYSVYGQSQVEGGIVVRMNTLIQPPVFGPDWVEVSAGMSWSEVLAVTLERGLRPPVLTNDLELSVGGTLSFGGVDGGSFRHGAQVDHVIELQVVTGEGKLEVCSADQLPELFNAVLAGQGQCAIILRARLRLIPAHTHARVFELLYSDLGTMLADQRMLVASGIIDRISACIRPSKTGRWYYYIQAEKNFSPPDEPDKSILPKSLGHVRGFERLYTLPYYDCMVRNPRFNAIRITGEVQLPHPWLNIFLSDEVINQFLADTFATLTPADIGIDFPVTFFLLDTSICTRPLFRLPNAPRVFLFHLMGTLPDQASAQKMIERYREFFERGKELGGIVYPINSLPFSKQDWQEHFGPHWQSFAQAKRRFDPKNILTPGPGIFLNQPNTF
jgi:FAD/FMN-containing dehydrogenase